MFFLLEHRYGDGRKLPLAIMVSDDTMQRTKDMLEEGDWFGMDEGQVTLMKQEKVAAIQVGPVFRRLVASGQNIHLSVIK